MDWTIQKRSGLIVPVEVRAQSLKIDNEALIMIFIRDRSKQNQLEKRRSLLESAIENAENAMATIHSSEEAGQPYISYVNPSFEKITGYTQEEICSDPILICSKLIANEALVEELRIKIEKGKAFENELKIIRASGESRWVQLNIQPINTSQEAFLLCTIKDINTRVLQKTMMDQFMKLGTDGFAIFDSQGYFREASIAWENMLGYSISQLKRKTAMELIHPDDLEKSTLGFMDLFEGKTIKGFINRYQHAEGHYVDLSWNVYPDAEGDRFYTMARDITGQMALMRELGEAKNLLEDKVTVRTKELEQSNQRLERFAFIASHDLRTPLRMISNFMSLLEKKIQHKLSDDEKDLFQFAVNGAKDMDGLIEAILKYSRAQRAIPKFENIDTLKNIQAVVIPFQDILDQKNGEITIQPIPNLQADRIQFRQIMQNLIGNALKFSSEEAPKIEISCETKKDRVHISVSDNGIGMDLSGDFNIFDLFEKGKGPKAEGHGIGLAICRDFVQNHGGDIRVVSEPGKGSTFYFDMPKSADVEAA